MAHLDKLMTDNSSDHKEFFPYLEPRQGQTEMMQEIETAVRTAVNICAEAPNGFGKTCVTLSGVLPWIKENKGKAVNVIFYVGDWLWSYVAKSL